MDFNCKKEEHQLVYRRLYNIRYNSFKWWRYILMVQKDVVFLVFAVLCGWLILDQIVGKKLIGQFVTMILPSQQVNMDTLKSFYEDTTFIVSFLVMVIVIQMTLGKKFTDWFLILVLFSIIIINSDKFITFLQDSFKTN